MSYDLNWCRQPDDVLQAPSYEERSRRRNAAGSYLGMSVWGMTWLRRVMADLGMLAMGQPAAVPRPEVFGLTDPVPWPGESDDPSVQAYWQADEDWRRAGLDAPGIPVYKLSTNDRWVVTAEEIEQALAALGDQPQPEHDCWQCWLGFLSGALAHDGFVVG